MGYRKCQTSATGVTVKYSFSFSYIALEGKDATFYTERFLCTYRSQQLTLFLLCVTKQTDCTLNLEPNCHEKCMFLQDAHLLSLKPPYAPALRGFNR